MPQHSSTRFQLPDVDLTTPGQRLRLLLMAMFACGVYACLPDSYDHEFRPIFLIMVIFPVVTIIIAWLYLQFVCSRFSLICRKMPEISLEKEYIDVELFLEYRCRLPFPVACLYDNFPAVDIMTSPEILVDYENFAKSHTVSLRYRHCLNRGYGSFIAGPAHLIMRDPFNFFEKQITLPLTTPFKVWINPPSQQDLDLVKNNALTPVGDSRSALMGHGMEFYGIKEYVAGDDTRAISWLKTAQTGIPVIKQFERDTRPEVMVLLHTDRSQLRGFGFGNTMKRLFRIAAGIIAETHHRGLSASIAFSQKNEPSWLTISSSVPVYGFMTELLSGLEPGSAEDLAALLNLAMNHAGPGSIVIFLSQTINVQIDSLLCGLLALQGKGARVSFQAIDDSDQARFSEASGIGIGREEFVSRLEEMDISFVLLPSRNEAQIEEKQ
jgi:uncharacterized protein (DUF58 family)